MVYSTHDSYVLKECVDMFFPFKNEVRLFANTPEIWKFWKFWSKVSVKILHMPYIGNFCVW